MFAQRKLKKYRSGAGEHLQNQYQGLPSKNLCLFLAMDSNVNNNTEIVLNSVINWMIYILIFIVICYIIDGY